MSALSRFWELCHPLRLMAQRDTWKSVATEELARAEFFKQLLELERRAFALLAKHKKDNYDPTAPTDFGLS